MGSLDGKIALITGSSQGIGFDIAQRMGRAGAKVAICARNSLDLQGVQESFANQNIENIVVALDLIESFSAKKLVDRVIETWGRLDILVNNVGGIHKTGSFLELSDEDWIDCWELNFMTAVRCIRESIPYLKLSESPRIINISSFVAKQPGLMNPHYSAAKAALNNFTKHLANTLSVDRILVNAVSPGNVHTEGWDLFLEEKARTESRDLKEVTESEERRVSASTPIGRMAGVAEISAAVLFLASQEASYVSGIDFVVDGGKIKTI